MIRTAKVSGVKELARLLRNMPGRIARAKVDVLRQSVRELAYQYGRETDPPDAGGEAAVQGFRDRIAAEVAAVYPTREQPAKVYRLLQHYQPELAKAYWHAYKSKQITKMAAVLRRAAVPQGGANARQLKQWRTGRRGKVDKRRVPAALVRGHEQRRMIREQQALAGVAKAGWHQAARGLGGRVRRNLVGPDGQRSTAEKFPAYVRKVSRKVPGLGGAVIRPDSVTIYTTVRHAREALDDRKRQGAEAQAEQNFLKAMAAEIEAINRSFNQKAA